MVWYQCYGFVVSTPILNWLRKTKFCVIFKLVAGGEIHMSGFSIVNYKNSIQTAAEHKQEMKRHLRLLIIFCANSCCVHRDGKS